MDDKIEEVESKEALKINNIETPTEPQRVVEEPARPTSDNELDSILSNNDLLNSKIDEKIIAKDNKFYNDAKVKQAEVVVVESASAGLVNKVVIGGILVGLCYLVFKYIKGKKQKAAEPSTTPDVLKEPSIWEQ